MKIAVYGSAVSSMADKVINMAQEVGRLIAVNNHQLLTGACIGIPYEAVKGAKAANGYCVGYSPAINFDGQKEYGPTEGFDEIVYIPKDYMYADNVKVCEKYRNLASAAATDAAIIIGGRIGTMDEFTNAYDIGKVIGVLTGTGGITDESIKTLLKEANKETGAKVIFNDNPEELINEIIKLF